MGGLRGEEKWTPDRIGTPEAGETRRGRWEGPSGRSRRGVEWRVSALPTQAQGGC